MVNQFTVPVGLLFPNKTTAFSIDLNTGSPSSVEVAISMKGFNDLIATNGGYSTTSQRWQGSKMSDLTSWDNQGTTVGIKQLWDTRGSQMVTSIGSNIVSNSVQIPISGTSGSQTFNMRAIYSISGLEISTSGTTAGNVQRYSALQPSVRPVDFQFAITYNTINNLVSITPSITVNGVSIDPSSTGYGEILNSLLQISVATR